MVNKADFTGGSIQVRLTNPKQNPDGYACPSCKQLLMSDHEAERLRQQLTEAQEALAEEQEENKIIMACLNGSTKAKYTAELYDRQVERAEKAEALIEELGNGDVAVLVKRGDKYRDRAFKLGQENKRLLAIKDAAVAVHQFKDIREDASPEYHEKCNKAMGALDRAATAYLSEQALKEKE